MAGYWPIARMVSAFLTEVTPVTPFAASVALSICAASGTVPSRVTAPPFAMVVMSLEVRPLVFVKARRTFLASCLFAALADFALGAALDAAGAAAAASLDCA